MGSPEQLTRIPGPGLRRDHRAARPGIRGAWAALVVSALARAVLVAMVALAAWSLAPAAFGMTSTTVMSGSMAPAIEAGDVVVTHPAAAADLRIGAVLLVDDPDHAGRLRLHRVVSVEDGRVRLRGDANRQPDSSTVAASQVHGVGFLRVPYAGLPLLWARTGEWVRAWLFAGGSATLMALVRTDRLLSVDARGSRRAASAATLVLVVVVAASVPPPPAWAGFSAATAPPASTFATSTFPCLTDPRPATSSVAAASVDYRFAEPTGTTTQNVAASGNDGLLLGSVDHLAGSCVAGDAPGVVLGRTGPGVVVASTRMQSPTTLTMAVWFRTGTAGGLLAGFGGSGIADPSAAGAYDRQLTMNADGSLTFRVSSALGIVAGINTPAPATPSRGYADDQWHQAVVTLSGALNMSLYVDGVLVTQALSLSLSVYPGYFRFGYDAVLGGTSAYRGAMTGVQVWTSTALGAADVAKLYTAGH